MRAYQTMIASDGYEVCLFPFEYMYISQGEGESYSHTNTYNIDFLGYNSNGIVLNCPFYAPCTLKCVDIWDSSSNTRVYESVNKVHLANGNIDYLTIYFSHDDNPPHNVGDVINQGQLLGRTGTTGYVTGDHIHSCCGEGRYIGFTQRVQGGVEWDLTNRIHYYYATYVNDTVLVEDYNYNWTDYNDPIIQTSKRKKFNFVLFSNELKKQRKLTK